jgi:hypothetical protein
MKRKSSFIKETSKFQLGDLNMRKHKAKYYDERAEWQSLKSLL